MALSKAFTVACLLMATSQAVYLSEDQSEDVEVDRQIKLVSIEDILDAVEAPEDVADEVIDADFSEDDPIEPVDDEDLQEDSLDEDDEDVQKDIIDEEEEDLNNSDDEQVSAKTTAKLILVVADAFDEEKDLIKSIEEKLIELEQTKAKDSIQEVADTVAVLQLSELVENQEELDDFMSEKVEEVNVEKDTRIRAISKASAVTEAEIELEKQGAIKDLISHNLSNPLDNDDLLQRQEVMVEEDTFVPERTSFNEDFKCVNGVCSGVLDDFFEDESRVSDFNNNMDEAWSRPSSKTRRVVEEDAWERGTGASNFVFGTDFFNPFETVQSLMPKQQP